MDVGLRSDMGFIVSETTISREKSRLNRAAVLNNTRRPHYLDPRQERQLRFEAAGPFPHLCAHAKTVAGGQQGSVTRATVEQSREGPCKLAAVSAPGFRVVFFSNSARIARSVG